MIKATEVEQTLLVDATPLTILHRINLHIEKGESIAIVGASGSGKSTLLGLLAGLDVPSSGEILIGGNNISQLNEEQRAKVRAEYVSFIFQNFQLLPSYTALDNVVLPLKLKGVSDPEVIANDYLDRVGLSQRRLHRPNQLSGGEQQRVAIARAFACRSPILFADEPTGNLDSATGKQITDLIFELNAKRGTTLVLVTHDASLAHHCDRTVNLDGGRLFASMEH